MGVYRLIHPTSSMSGLTTIPSLSFPSATQRFWEPDCSGPFPLLSQRQQAQRGGLAAQAQKWAEPGQEHVWGFSKRRNHPSGETIGHEGSSAYKARAGIRPGMLLTRHWVLASIPCPGCRLLPPLWLAHPKTGFAFSSSPGQQDRDWRQHPGLWAGSREEGPDSSRLREICMKPCRWGKGALCTPSPSWQGSVPHPTAGSNPHTHVVCALTASREEWKHLEVTCKQAALSVNEEI